jgi:hypothetical protein
MKLWHRRHSRRQQALFLGMLCVLTLAFLASVATYSNPSVRAALFIRYWGTRFRSVRTIEDARRMARLTDAVFKELPSGDWFMAVCEHSCCSGAGFDATVIHDSAGATYTDTTYTFCGMEALWCELGSTDARNLRQFYASLTYLDLHRY